jgi:small-conductance mechanosensitive channel
LTKRCVPIVLAWLVLASAQALAQTAPLGSVDDQAGDQLRAVRVAARAADIDDDGLRAQIAAIPPIQADLASHIDDLNQRLQNLNARLAQIGPPPTPPQSEAPDIRASRQQLVQQQRAIDAEAKQAGLLAVEAQQLLLSLTERRQQLFAQHLWASSRSVLSPRLWIDFAAAAPKDIANLRGVMAEEGQALAAASKPAAIATWVLVLVAAIALIGPGRLLLDRFGIARLIRRGQASRLRRASLALWLALTSVAAPLLAGTILRGVLADAGALTPAMDRFAQLAIRILAFAMLFEGLGRAILSPKRPGWRLAPIPDDVVARLAPYPGLVAGAAALAALIAGANAAFGASLPTSVASDCVTLLLELGAVGAGLATLGVARHGHVADETVAEAETRLPWVLAALASWLTIAAAVSAVLLGYQALASFLAREMIWTALIFAALFVAIRFVDEVFPALLSPERSLGRFARIAIGLSPGSLDQIGVLLSGLSRLSLLMLAWIAILEPFGGAIGNLYGSLTATPAELKLGQVTISPQLVLGGLIVFFAGLAITRAIRGWMEHRYLPKTHMDLGARASLSLAITYVGGLIAALLTCAYLGLSLDKITLVASALSVGIGFGLQAIIGNFISGLILLAERPMKVGDWIAIDNYEGDVRRVNVRATEIELFDRSKLIVPNADLISKPVRNITHAGSMGRISITLLIDNQADPAAVRGLILEGLRAHPDVREEPTPGVFLNSIRDGALEFNIIAYVASPRDVFRVKSELLYALVPALREAGVAFASSSPSITINPPAIPLASSQGGTPMG